MATTDERMKILKMIDEGKISAEEGAKLLAALTESQKTSRKAPISRGLLKRPILVSLMRPVSSERAIRRRCKVLRRGTM